MLVTGVTGYGIAGTVGVQSSIDVYLTGVQAQGIIGQVLVWGQIPDVPDPHWTDINDDGDGGWVQIDDATTDNWELIAA